MSVRDKWSFGQCSVNESSALPLMRYRFRLFSCVSVLALAVATESCRRAPSTASSSQDTIDKAPLSPLPTALYGADLPESIDDETFWGMVTGLSEPGGYFQSENFVSNELGVQHVMARLESSTPPGGVYVGVGPEQNFTYLGTLRPRIAFVVDIRRQNLLQHLWYKAVFELSPTRAEFLSRLFARPLAGNMPTTLSADSLIVLLDNAAPDTAFFHKTFADVEARLLRHHRFTLDSVDLATLRYVDSIFFLSGPTLNYSSGSTGRSGGRSGRGGYNRMPTFAQIASATNESGVNRGFLGSEITYGVVRDLQRRNLVVPLVGNFAGPKAVRAVGDWLRNRGAKVNVFYTSNVEQYLFQQGDNWALFYRNVASMPLDSSSRFIRSVTNRGFNSPSNFLMTQLTSSIFEVVRGVETGAVRGYGDVIYLSQP